MGLADAVLDLPGLCPAAGSLAALALERDVAATVRCDPAAVLFLARQKVPFDSSFTFPTLDDAFLLASLELVEHRPWPFVDWRQPGLDRVWRAAQLTASVAEELAKRADVSTAHAFVAGLLTPLNWFGFAAAAPERVPELLHAVELGKSDWHMGACGLDQASLTRRLVRSWRLPEWLANIVGYLDWDANLVERLGADAKLVAVVQLAALAIQKTDVGLGLAIGSRLPDLLKRLQLTELAVTAIAAERHGARSMPPLDDPATQPLLADVLRLTLDNRRRHEKPWIEQLSRDIDRLQNALVQQIADEKQRLAEQKLSSLAEFAAGAGHEINNPLAVISGQAQYILKQMNWVEELLLEEPTPGILFEAVKSKLTKPLQTIVGQSQRIHQVITDIMLFARPQSPRVGVVPVAKLIAEAVATVRALAEERRVRLVCPDAPAQLAVRVDALQIRLALANLLRNGLEAAPAEGWASLRVQREPNGDVAFAIEDNGPGLGDYQAEHLFDPFYSGRAAGRGRGLGLSTAWRLARQHGGDVRRDQNAQGATRFLLILPASEVIDNYVPSANGKREAVGYQFSGIG